MKIERNEEEAFARDLDMKDTDYYRNLMKAKEARSKKEEIEKNPQSIPEENKKF